MTVEENLLALFRTHVLDALDQVKDDVSRPPKINSKKADQKPFSPNDLWLDTFVEDRWKQNQALLTTSQSVKETSTASTSNATASSASVLPVAAQETKPGFLDTLSAYVTSLRDSTSSSSASSTASFSNPHLSSQSKIAALTLGDLLCEELILSNGKPKINLTEEDLRSDWTRNMPKVGKFHKLGRSLVQALQKHLKKRNPKIFDPKISDPTILNKDYVNGPIPLFFRLFANIAIAACINYEKTTIQAYYLVLLMKYIILNILPEFDLGSAYFQDEASQEVRKLFSIIYQVNLDEMEVRARAHLASRNAPQIFEELTTHNESVCSNLIELLVTLLYDGEDEIPKTEEYLKVMLKEYQEQARAAIHEDKQPKDISLILVLMLMQAEANASLINESSNSNNNAAARDEDEDEEDEEYEEEKEADQDDDEDNVQNSSDQDEEHLGSSDDDDDDEEDDNRVSRHNQLEMPPVPASTNKPTPKPTTKVVFQKGGQSVTLNIQASSSAAAPTLSTKAQQKINSMMSRVLPGFSEGKYFLGGVVLTAQDLVNKGFFDPESPYFNADDCDLPMAMLPTQSTRERLYIELMGINSGIPEFMNKYEWEVLGHGGDDCRRNLIIANWHLLRDYLIWYCMNTKRFMLTQKCANEMGNFGIYAIYAGPTHAGFQLTEQAVTRLSLGLGLLEGAIRNYLFTLKVPRNWKESLKDSGKLIRETQSSLEQMMVLLQDLKTAAHQWQVNRKENTQRIKKLFQYYDERTKFDTQIMSDEFLAADTAKIIKQLNDSQDSHSRARILTEFAEDLKKPSTKLTEDEKKALLRGTGTSSSLIASPSNVKLIDRDLSVDGKKLARKREQERIKARKGIIDVSLALEQEKEEQQRYQRAFAKEQDETVHALALVRASKGSNNSNYNSNVRTQSHGSASTHGSSSSTHGGDLGKFFGKY